MAADPVCVQRVHEIFEVEEHAEEGSEATMTVMDLCVMQSEAKEAIVR